MLPSCARVIIDLRQTRRSDQMVLAPPSPITWVLVVDRVLHFYQPNDPIMARHRIHTEIDIMASADRVWSVLSDFAAYPTWNPFIREIIGQPIPGTRLKLRIHPPGDDAMTFRPTVLVARPGAELRWLGRLFVPGLFNGEHYFRLTPEGEGMTRLLHGEKFSGLLVGLLRDRLDRQTRAGFVAMNLALKTVCESS